MNKGKLTCETLKAIRQQIADANDINYTPAKCDYEGSCTGTCLRCEQERKYIEQQLSLKQKAGQAIRIVGLASSLTALATPQFAAAQSADTLDSIEDVFLQWETGYRMMMGLGPNPFEESQWDEMTKFVSENKNQIFLMFGHTDKRGSEVYNLKLSLKRSEYLVSVIKRKLAEQYNEDAVIIPIGLAFYEPVVRNAGTEEEHERNRRNSLETYTPGRYSGKAAAMVEYALWRKLVDSKHNKTIANEVLEYERLNALPYEENMKEAYSKLAEIIHNKRIQLVGK